MKIFKNKIESFYIIGYLLGLIIKKAGDFWIIFSMKKKILYVHQNYIFHIKFC